MKKINDELFKKNEMTEREKFNFKGGDSKEPTYSDCVKFDSTWYFWDDDNGNTQTDTTTDTILSLLPAVNNITKN